MGWAKKISLIMLMAIFGVLPVGAQSGMDDESLNQQGSYGLGLVLGEPGIWGVAGIIWMDQRISLQPAVKFDDGGKAIIQIDYLWHPFALFPTQDTDGRMPFYMGIGIGAMIPSSAQIEARMPVGFSFLLDKKSFPMDLYLQAVPSLWFNDDNTTTFDLDGELGTHFYF